MIIKNEKGNRPTITNNKQVKQKIVGFRSFLLFALYVNL